MKKLIVSAGICAMLAVFLHAGCINERQQMVPKNHLATAGETVKAFCDLDGEGARLTSATWSQVLPYIAWTEEAGWDRTVVIAGYRIGSIINRSENLSMVTVEYEVAGNLSQDYLPAKKNETVVFTVQKTSEGWKIKSPDFMPPHVFIKPLLRHLRETKRLELADKIR